MITPVSAPPRRSVGYSCGPVRLVLSCEDRSLLKSLEGLVTQYDAPWPGPIPEFFVTIERGAQPAGIREPAGVYLRSYRLRVDRSDGHLLSLSGVGVWMDFDEASRSATIRVPESFDWRTVIEEVEQQLVLLLARAWSSVGWTPLHGGSLIPPDGHGCILVCAHSGVGKTTFVTSLLRRGWRTLGDDKTLLQTNGGVVTARSLSRRMHLHPSLANWFPELGIIGNLPRYSRWTEKRVAGLGDIWPGQLLDAARPMVLIQLERGMVGCALKVRPLDVTEILDTLLRQIAIPADAAHARPLLACAAALSRQLRGAAVAIGENAFADSTFSARIENALQELLP